MEGREVVSLGGVSHGELSEVFFGLTRSFKLNSHLSNVLFLVAGGGTHLIGKM